MSTAESVREKQHAIPSMQVLASRVSIYLGVSRCGWQGTRKGLARERGERRVREGQDNIVTSCKRERGSCWGCEGQVRWGPEWVEGQPNQAWMKL